MKRSPSQVDNLIKHFRENKCTPEELEWLQQWMTQLDVSDESTDLAQDRLQSMKDRMYRQLMSKAPVVMHRRESNRRRYLAAAGWLVLIASSVLLWTIFRKSPVPAQVASLITITNDLNHVRKISLPDGSTVYLNRSSTLSFDSDKFNKKQRFVQLSGEGFFEVAKDASRPFVVETGSLHTKVLGTAFNIEAYHHESEIRVSLVHGKIALNDTAGIQSTLLAPDQTFRYFKRSGTWEVLPVEGKTVALWTQGWLVFNEVPLQEAIERLKATYNLQIDYQPQLLRNKRITASFKTASWSEALENMLFVHGLHYKMVDHKIMITDR
jgi:transmembrane sensor